MTADRPVRVRFAPSPTGRLHIGGARTALFNWAFARRHGGCFVLRVEDTDAERNTEEALRSILDSLRWLGLDWDEGPEADGGCGPYFQSERASLYAEAAAQLLAGGRLYRCFCSAERLSGLREAQREAKQPMHYDRRCRDLDPAESGARAGAGEQFTLRFAVPDGEPVRVADHIRGAVTFRSEEVEDWVAIRSNGSPTYNFACVVDDAGMRISHVLRGEEHLINTPKQLLLYRALGLDAPEYAHVPLILGSDGKKLSKRTGDTALEDYRAKGYPPEALFNFLCLLGFSIDDRTDVFGPAELTAAFALERINKAGAVFDTDRLLWLCGEYVRSTPAPELTGRVLPWLRDAGLVENEPQGERLAWLERVVTAQRDRFRLYGEIAGQVAYLFQERVVPDEKAAPALRSEDARAHLEAVAAALEAAPDFPPADFDAWIKELAEQRGAGLGKIMKPVRAALSGMLGGPPVGEILSLLGRERALERLRAPAQQAAT